MRSRIAVVELFAVPQGIADPGRLGIKTDIPAQIDVDGFDQRLDLDLHRQQMRNPPRDHLAERGEPAPAGS